MNMNSFAEASYSVPFVLYTMDRPPYQHINKLTRSRLISQESYNSYSKFILKSQHTELRFCRIMYDKKAMKELAKMRLESHSIFHEQVPIETPNVLPWGAQIHYGRPRS